MDEHDEWGLNQGQIDMAAAIAKLHLKINGVARVVLEPGDATAYQFLVVNPGPMWQAGTIQATYDYWVALMNPFGGAYPWAGEFPMHREYTAQKWVRPDQNGQPNMHTAEVVARFLNALRNELGYG